MTNFVKNSEFNVNNLVKMPMETKQSKLTIDTKNPTGPLVSSTYYQSQIKYEYEKVDEKGQKYKVVDTLCIELPECKTPSGLVLKDNVLGWPNATIYVQLDMSNDETKRCMSMGESHTGYPAGCINQLYNWLMKFIWDKKENLSDNIKSLEEMEHMRGLFPYPFMFQKDGNKIMASSNPSKYLPVLSYGKIGTVNRSQAIFTLPILDEAKSEAMRKPVYQNAPWELLTSVEMKFRPVVRFKMLKIVAGKAKIDCEITYAVISDIKPVNSESIQTDQLATLVSNKSGVDTLQAQIAILTRRLESSKITATATTDATKVTTNTTDATKVTTTTTSTTATSTNVNTAIPQQFQQQQQAIPQQFQQQQQAIPQQFQQQANPQQFQQQTPNPFAAPSSLGVPTVNPTLSAMMNSIPTVSPQ